MPYKAKVYKVMIASPSDVATERTVIRNVIHEWNNVHSEQEDIVLMPVGWESHSSPSMGDRPQAIINKQVLADCDLLIAVFWTRLGSPTGKAPSGTVEEIEEHITAGKPAMIYFSSAPVVPESVDREQYQALLDFKEEMRPKGLFETYDSISEFKEKLTRQLAQTVIRYFVPKKNGRPSQKPSGSEAPVSRPQLPALSEEAKQLLMEASQDKGGIVLRVRTNFGLAIQTNGRNLVENQHGRIEAKWEGGLRQLREHGLLQDRGSKGEVFSLTDEGYRVADLLHEQQFNVPRGLQTVGSVAN
jgi:hypothetical protein